MTTRELLCRAKNAAGEVALLTEEARRRVLDTMAEQLLAQTEAILAANRADMAAAQMNGISPVMQDRLLLTETRIAAMAQGVPEVAALPCPVGRVLDRTTRADGLTIEKTAVPFGVVAIIYESRPNVTSDAAALALMSGNACVLRGGKEAHQSAAAVTAALRTALSLCRVNPDAVCLVEDTTRKSATEIMTAQGLVDLLIPRGGAGLIAACVENATVPCIQTGTGICHIYTEKTVDIEQALTIVENAKTSRPSVCNAAEVCLVDSVIAHTFLPQLRQRLVIDRAAKGLPPVELRLCERAQAYVEGTPATEQDFDTEFLDYILAVKIVDGVEEAIAHIAAHSTGHSEAILTNSEEAAERFTRLVDSAAVYVNASTRFTDGGEFGLGCEMGISTQKLHARGPMGLCELTTYKYIVRGNGQIR